MDCLDLDGHPQVAEGNQQVNFTTPDSHIAFEDPGTTAAEEAGGEGFAGSSELLRSQS